MSEEDNETQAAEPQEPEVGGDRDLAATCDVDEISQAGRLAQILDQYLEDLKAGQAVSKEQLLADHPDLADRLKNCLAGIDFLQPSQPTAEQPRQIGDFRILREVGRGGMGAVFEADQISLGRRVALKILRFGRVSDSDAIGRFQREAETVANLHHTNIVPVYSVGSESGVSFYAMQFIDGQSLDRVLRESDEPLEAEMVARWGLQAAEALAHAHQRGVIHRDVKPSNLILDDEGRIWLTDFGLAKRLDDVTLSMTGAILGTPRYMSPEQADASQRRVDHRTDLYSLGATLYELACSRPVFSADTPHGVLQQILTTEPDSPGKHRPSLPRDLQTILMKCLSKDPAQRYESAQDVADDLRAFLDNRPISARRPHVWELAIKSFRRKKKSVVLTLGSVASTAIVLLTSLVSYYGYQRSQISRISLQTDSPPLIAELLDPTGEAIAVPVTLPTQQAIEIPSGEIQVRVSGGGQLSQTFHTTLVAGETEEFDVELKDALIGPSIRFDRALKLVQLGTIVKAVEMDDQGLSIRNLADGKRHASFRHGVLDGADSLPDVPWLKESPGFRWWTETSVYQDHKSGYDKHDTRPFLVGEIGREHAVRSTSPDLDGDSIPDLVVAARHQAWWLALSGKDLSLIWFAPRGADLHAVSQRKEVHSATISPPISVRDLDGDGVNDFIGSFGDAPNVQQAKRWLEAISGADGTTIWSTPMSPAWFQLPPGAEVPYAYQWFIGSSSGASSSGGGSYSNNMGIVTRDRHYEVKRTGQHVYVSDAPQVFGDDLCFLAGNRMVRIGLADGKISSEGDVVDSPSLPVQWADLDGDGASDAVMVVALGSQPTMTGYPPQLASVPRVRVIAWSQRLGKELWRRDVTAKLPARLNWAVKTTHWPSLGDVDGDGCADVLVPNGTSDKTRNWQGTPWGAVELIDGRTGESKWIRRVPNMDQSVSHCVIGPDVDDDGNRDVYTATSWGERYDLFIDCLSGDDGTPIWHRRQSLQRSPRESREFMVAQLRWWAQADESGPTLMVSSTDQNTSDATVTHGFSATTGKLTRIVRGFNDLFVIDVDGDATEDLGVVNKPSADLGGDGGGELRVFRGVTGEHWRRIGEEPMPIADWDGDNVRDLLVKSGTHLRAFSGLTGATLWERPLADSYFGEMEVASGGDFGVMRYEGELRLPSGRPASADLDGDGIVDIVLCKSQGMARKLRPLIALSGVDGAMIWEAELEIQNVRGVLSLETRDIDNDGEVEIVLFASIDWEYPRGWSYSTADEQLWIGVFSGKTGRLRWKQPLSPAYGSGQNTKYETSRQWIDLTWGDLNDDGVMDVVVPADGQSNPGRQLELRALSGKDGMLLWTYELQPTRQPRQSFSELVQGKITDLDGDGQPEFVHMRHTQKPSGKRVTHLIGLSGNDGELLWQWETPVDWNFGNPNRYGGHDPARFIRSGFVTIHRGDHQQIALLIQRENLSVTMPILSASGEQVSEYEVVPPGTNYQRVHRPLFPHDLDGDGREELILAKEDSLIAIKPENPDQPVWTHPIRVEDNHFFRLLGYLSLDEREPPQLIVRTGLGSNRVESIDVGSGQTLWHCNGPTPRSRDLATSLLYVGILSNDSHNAPKVYFANDDFSLCRSGGFSGQLAQDPIRQSSGLVASESLEGGDPRWTRSLPGLHGMLDSRELLAIPWMVFYAVTLLIVPVAYVGYLIYIRQFNLKWLLFGPVVVSIFFMGHSVDHSQGNLRDLGDKIFVGLMALAPVVAFALFVYWVWTKKWWTLSAWSILSLLAGVAFFLIAYFALDEGMRGVTLPEERMAFDGWYLYWIPGAIMTSWVLLIYAILQGAVWMIRGRRRSAVVAT